MKQSSKRNAMKYLCGLIGTIIITTTLTTAAIATAAEAVKGKKKGPQHYSLEQAMSDRAQLHTIAFNGLAFLTGDFGASTFIPPGKVADYFGFQYMRDIDAAVKGHNPMFLNRVAGNVLDILSEEQLSWFADLAREQAPQLENLAMMRLPLIKAFHIAAEQGKPLNQEAVVNHVGDIFELDAEVSQRRAEVMAKVALSLTEKQKQRLSVMKFGDFNTWPEVSDEKVKSSKRQFKGEGKMIRVAYMTYASEFFSWYAGSVKADTYFCPERHGTYFGGFYMKDMPAMGKRDYDIPLDITGNSGETFLTLLDEAQRSQITSTIDKQAQALDEVAKVREEMAVALREYLKGNQADKDMILALGRRYGELDGLMSYYYATAFANVNQTLTAEQRQKMVALRNLDGYKSAPYYIYSRPARSTPDLDKSVTQFF